MGAWFKVSVLAAVLALGSLVSPAAAGEQQKLTTDKDRVNYAIGVNIIGNIRQQGVEIDLDRVIQGMKDAYAGDKLLLGDEELRIAIDRYQIAVKQNRSKMMAKAADDNRREGEAFLAENGRKAGVVTLPSGLQYRVLKAGDGRKPADTDTVECNYRGTLLNGTEFDSSHRSGKPAVLKVASVIPGWREALKLMPAGSTWQIFVPSQLAYGPRGSGGQIGPNATLIFELELLSIK